MSLGPTFVPARLVGLAVEPPSTLLLTARFPFVLRRPLDPSVTFWEGAETAKLLTCYCPRPRTSRIGLGLALQVG